VQHYASTVFAVALCVRLSVKRHCSTKIARYSDHKTNTYDSLRNLVCWWGVNYTWTTL